MKKFISAIVLLLSLMAHSMYGVASEEGPLALMKEPQQNGQNSGASQQQLPGLQGQEPAGEFYDIYGVVSTRAAVPYFYIICGALLLLAAGLLAYWFYKKKGRTVAAPIIPPWERALADLGEAKALQSAAQGRLYMDRVSQILRYYIEQRFAVKTTRQTTREFLSSLRNAAGFELNNYRAELQHCLEQADMAKFAHQVSDEQNLAVMEQAVAAFVQSTRLGEGEKEVEQ